MFENVMCLVLFVFTIFLAFMDSRRSVERVARNRAEDGAGVPDDFATPWRKRLITMLSEQPDYSDWQNWQIERHHFGYWDDTSEDISPEDMAKFQNDIRRILE